MTQAFIRALTKSQRITNSAGAVTSTIDLDPWGGETARSSNSAFQPHKYTTYERDANGGDEAMHRRYQSSISRFSQPDPYDGSYSLSDPQSFNRYAYVNNDPVNFVDPSGLNASGCSAEFSFAQCGGNDGFWRGPGESGGGGGGGFGDDVARYNRDFGGMPSNVASSLAAYLGRLQNTMDANRARSALNSGNYTLLQSILNGNPNVGISVNGVSVWGAFGAAFVGGYAGARQQLMLAAGGNDVLKATDLALRLMVRLGWNAVVKKISEIRGPDFQLVNINWVGGITRFVARGDDLSSALHGVSAGGDFQISYAVGWMLQVTTPSREQIRDWGSGLSVSSDAFFIGGGGVVRSMSSSTRGVYVGVGAGGGWGASFQYPVR